MLVLNVDGLRVLRILLMEVVVKFQYQFQSETRMMKRPMKIFTI